MTSSNRRAVIKLDPTILLDLCKTNELRLKVESDIPFDAVLEGAQYDSARDIWLLAFSSDSLPEVPISQTLPILNSPTFTRIYDEA